MTAVRVKPSRLLTASILISIMTCPVPVRCEPAPGFNLPLLSGSGSLSMDSLRGSVVYVDFWASWCGPCRQSLPLYDEMASRMPRESFNLVAINLDEHQEDATSFLETHPVSYVVLHDPAGVSAAEWQIKAMPSSFLVAQDGKIVREWAGFKKSHLKEIEDEIHLLLE